MPHLTAYWLLLLLLPAALNSCGKTPDGETAGASSALPQSQKTPLSTIKLTLGSHTITVECAVTSDEKSRGLMYRKSMPQDAGMLFVFDKPHQASFWMKNTLIPLSIAYINQDGVILEIHDMTPLELQPVTSRSYLVRYALEMNQGWFKKNGIEAGDHIQGIPGLAVPSQ
jgi:hypothetical protein